MHKVRAMCNYRNHEVSSLCLKHVWTLAVGFSTALYFGAVFVHENVGLDECIDRIKIRL